MSEGTTAGRRRNPERTRKAILDAAEHLFAEGGYEATTLQAIGERAGVSRGTPGYFFGGKEALYGAVLERFLAEELAFVGEAQERAAESGGGDGLEETLSALVGSFLEFLALRPTFVRLLEREALAGAAILRVTDAHAASIRDGLAMTAAVTASPGARDVDPSSFLLSVIALCWFPFAHAETYARDLGVDIRLPADRERWKCHVVDLTLNGIRQR